ncbi:MAG: hypothetical protein WBI82_10040 [Sphaerochaeta sp.]
MQVVLGVFNARMTKIQPEIRQQGIHIFSILNPSVDVSEYKMMPEEQLT